MNTLSRRTLLAASGGIVLARPALAQAGWPSRPVQMICPWAAGGGTDAVLRIIASLLEKELGQPFNVVNRTGGNGVVGHAAIVQAQPDGYTIGMLTSEICMLHWQGLTQITFRDYTPLSLMNFDPAGVQVNTSSPWKDIRQCAEAIKASRPGQLKASGTGQGGTWHLALAGWLVAMDLQPDHVRWVPSNGAAPAMQDLAAGGLDLTTNSVVEARAMLDAGRARSLVVMGPQRLPVWPDIPTLKEAMNLDWTAGAWRGIAGPRNMPQEARTALEAGLKRVYDSHEYQDFMNARGFGLLWGDAAGFARHLETQDASLGSAMKAAGLAKA